MIWEGESVGSFVTLWVLGTEARLSVEWLHHVSDVVDQEPKGVGLGEVGLPWVKTVVDVVINVRIKIFFTVFA